MRMLQPSREYVTCNLCGADEPLALLDGEKLPDGRPAGVVRCARCGLVYRNVRGRPEQAREYYAAGYYPAELRPDWVAARQRVFRRAVQFLETFRRTGRVLDVGAGHGFFLQLCRERGWQGFGVEPSGRAVDYARSRLG
ncbi:MAG TPA: methyltransferase domain-containing protein, partial [Firmicutes bacterium]|nr:methyltransferase domain-containing protein [Bacillota bacterium]